MQTHQDPDRSSFRDAVEAGKLLAAVTRINDTPIVIGITPQGGHQVLELAVEKHAAHPTSKRATVEVFDTQSFVDYIRRHKTPGTEVFIDRNVAGPSVTGILDSHAADTPGWARHRLKLTTRLTEEWKAWAGKNGAANACSQVQLAEFVETHLAEIAEPAGNTLLEMVKSLAIRRSVNFEGAVDLTNGQTQITYHENIDGTTGKQNITIPNKFTLGIAPFEGAALYRIDARLRYRLDTGKVSLWFDLVEPHRILDAAFTERIAEIRIGLDGTDVPLFFGSAPAPSAAL